MKKLLLSLASAILLSSSMTSEAFAQRVATSGWGVLLNGSFARDTETGDLILFSSRGECTTALDLVARELGISRNLLSCIEITGV